MKWKLSNGATIREINMTLDHIRSEVSRRVSLRRFNTKKKVWEDELQRGIIIEVRTE